MIQTGNLQEEEKLTLTDVKKLLHERIKTISFERAKEDILPFLTKDDVIIWDKNYFDFLIDNLKSNEITVYKNEYDSREFGKANCISKEQIFNVGYPNKKFIGEKLREFKIKFKNYIVSDDSIINFGQKTNKFETYYVIEGLDEIRYLKSNLDKNKLISILKNM